MDVLNNSWLLKYPGFDRAVNSGNYLFGESVSLIDFIKVLQTAQQINRHVLNNILVAQTPYKDVIRHMQNRFAHVHA